MNGFIKIFILLLLCVGSGGAVSAWRDIISPVYILLLFGAGGVLTWIPNLPKDILQQVVSFGIYLRSKIALSCYIHYLEVSDDRDAAELTKALATYALAKKALDAAKKRRDLVLPELVTEQRDIENAVAKAQNHAETCRQKAIVAASGLSSDLQALLEAGSTSDDDLSQEIARLEPQPDQKTVAGKDS